jgi:hypothetical protein
MKPADRRKPRLRVGSPALWAIAALSVAVVAIFAGVIAAWPRMTQVNFDVNFAGDLSPDGIQWQSLRSKPVKNLNLGAGQSCPIAPAVILPAAGATGPLVYGIDPVHTTGLGPAFGGTPARGYPVRFYVSRSYHGPILVRIRSVPGGAPVGLSPGQAGNGAGPMEPPRRGARLIAGKGLQTADATGQRNLPTYEELDIQARSAQQTAGSPPGVDIWSAYAATSLPGCYSIQIDGIGFSEVMAFQVQLNTKGGPIPGGISGGA